MNSAGLVQKGKDCFQPNPTTRAEEERIVKSLLTTYSRCMLKKRPFDIDSPAFIRNVREGNGDFKRAALFVSQKQQHHGIKSLHRTHCGPLHK